MRRARRCRPTVRLHLQAIIHRLLAFQPAHRYQKRGEIQADLERIRPARNSGAASYYDTPATMPVTRAAGVAVVELPPSRSPSRARDAGRQRRRMRCPRPCRTSHGPSPAPAPAGRVDRTGARREAAFAMLRRLGEAAVVPWSHRIVADRRRRVVVCRAFPSTAIPAIDERTVMASREAYDGVEGWALLDLGLQAARRRVAPPHFGRLAIA